MTLPFERALSLENTRRFLLDLMDPKKTPRVPSEIRTRARWCLKHFPDFFDMEQAKKKCPDVFGDTDELTRRRMPKTQK